MKHKITKKDVFAFLGAVLGALITTLVNKISNEREIRNTVQAVLEEERRQINAMSNQSAGEAGQPGQN